MDIKYIETSLGTNNLKDYLIEQINIGKTESEKEVDNIINQVLAKTKNDALTEEDKSAILSIELIALQKIIYEKEISSVAFYLKNFKSYKNPLFNTKNESSEDDKLAEFIIEYYNFLNKPDWSIVVELKRFQGEFKKYFLYYFFEKKSEMLFMKLNELNYLEKFEWKLSTFEIGIIEFYKKLFLEKASAIKNFESKIQLLNHEKDSEINSLKSKIEHLNDKNSKHEGTIELYEDYHKKYLEHSPRLIVETYFGDNQPFLANFYNFLSEHLILRMTGWSHFYSCMAVNNNEVLNLNINKSKFIGRIFYNLINSKFLQPKFANETFIRSKFYLNEQPIVDTFFINHMNKRLKKEDYDFFETVDSFFENQKKIFFNNQ
jgi:hypothetical protein